MRTERSFAKDLVELTPASELSQAAKAPGRSRARAHAHLGRIQGGA